MKVSHVHCRVQDLPAAARWFEQVWHRPWGARAAYLKGPGRLTVEIEQLVKRT